MCKICKICKNTQEDVKRSEIGKKKKKKKETPKKDRLI